MESGVASNKKAEHKSTAQKIVGARSNKVMNDRIKDSTFSVKVESLCLRKANPSQASS